MIAKTMQEIVTDIKFYIAEQGSRYADWYVGVSKNAKDRLFNGHKVGEKTDKWIYRQAISSEVAREVEDHFFNVLGTDGGIGGGSGGDSSADMVYAYEKNSHTEP